VAVQEVESDVESFTSLSSLTGFFDRVVPKRVAAVRAMHNAKGPRFQTNSCISFTGNQNDEDQDGVPDADTVSYNCNDSTSVITGFFSYADPTPRTADVDVNYAANLSIAITSGSVDEALTLTGSSSVTQASGAIDEQGNWALNDVVTNNGDGDNGTYKLTASENATYTYGGAALTSFGNLPPGSFSLAGNWSYVLHLTNANVNLAFSISTPTALRINTSTCGNEAGIESGEVDIKFADGTLVTVVWSGCPLQPSITVS
jgi:hypothetical protein